MGCVQSQTKLKRKTSTKKLKNLQRKELKSNLNMLLPRPKKLKMLAIEHIRNQTESTTKEINSDQVKNLNDSKIEKLKCKLNVLSVKIEKLRNDLTNGNDTIYDYCSELKRLVQLKKEKQIAKLKAESGVDMNKDEADLNVILRNKIISIHTSHQTQIDKIDNYERETQKFFDANVSNSESLRAEIRTMFTFIKFYQSQFDNDLIKEFNYSKIDSKLHNLELELDDLAQETHLFIFNSNLLEFDASQVECIKSKEFLNFKTISSLRVPFESIDNSGSFAKFDLLNDENYLVIYKLKDSRPLEDQNYNRGDMTLLIFNQNEAKLKKRIVLRDCFISCLKHGSNLIAVSCSTSHAHLILVFDCKLNLKHKIDCKSTNLVAVNESYLYCSDFFNYDKLVNKAYDWSLNKCESNLKFQLAESKKPFFIDTRPSNVDQIEVTDERFVVSFFNPNDSKSILVFNQTGSLVKTIQVGRLAKFKLGLNSGLVILDNSRLLFFDSNACLVKSKELILTKKYFKHISNLKFLIDNNDCLHILNAFNLNIYKL